ncbi:MAG: hypothetical protein MZV63_32080 [Marinilabiliales bacterium]|nr:hypothetical protein [Marinilabiliales bacterium]
MNYHEDTAGGLMAKELITVNGKPDNANLPERKLRKQATEIDEVYYVCG